MLVQFSVSNYKIFKETATLSMLASKHFKDLPENVAEVAAGAGKLSVLKSAAIYGANASGKSKLLDAMQFMRTFVRNSSKESLGSDPIPVEAFRLNSETAQAPSAFEVVFLQEGIQYRYGFSADRQRIHSEWLYRKAFRTEVAVFSREGQTFSVHGQRMKKGNLLLKEDLVRENALLLSVAAQFKDEIALAVLAWFNKLQGISGIAETGYMGFTMRQLEDEATRLQVLDLLEHADIGISDIQLTQEVISTENTPEEARKLLQKHTKDGEQGLIQREVHTLRQLYDAENLPVSTVSFTIDKEESAGTRKYFALLGPMLAACKDGAVLFVDELDAKLHPNLVEKIIQFFHHNNTNPHHTQLIFNTHNTNLLNNHLLRCDQVWFTEKDHYGAASLYSLAEFKGARSTKENHAARYREGRYGAVPYLAGFDSLLQASSSEA